MLNDLFAATACSIMVDQLNFGSHPEWNSAEAFFQRDSVESLQIMDELPREAKELKDALSDPRAQSIRTQCLFELQIADRISSRIRTARQLRRLWLVATALAGILLSALLVWEDVSQRMEAILGLCVLIAIIGYGYLALRYKRLFGKELKAWQEASRTECALFEEIARTSSTSAQLWTAAYYLTKIGLKLSYGRSLFIRTVVSTDYPIFWGTRIKALIRPLEFGAIVLAFVTTFALISNWAFGSAEAWFTPSSVVVASVILTAIALLLLSFFLGKGAEYALNCWRVGKLIARLHDLKNKFNKFELGPSNIHQFLAETNQALIDEFSAEDEPPYVASVPYPDHATDFRLVDFIEVKGPDRARRIALYNGDVSEMPEPVDYLILSAFPNEYAPVPGTVIESLAKKGLSVADLAVSKEHDLRQSCGFWVSRDLSKSHPHLHIRRLLCFEPMTIGDAPKVVGEIFRGLFPFLDLGRGSTVATSLIAAGSQQWEPHQMFRPLVECAIEWLGRGLPLNELKIVVRSKSLATRVGHELFAIKLGKERAPLGQAPVLEYDVFVSYSTLDIAGAKALKDTIKKANPGVWIFDFKHEIDVGKSYQNEIDKSIESCRKIVALMSPSYFISPECQEELQIARLRNKRSGHSVLFPIYWKSLDAELMLWIQALTYADCRECDVSKLVDAVKKIAAEARTSA